MRERIGCFFIIVSVVVLVIFFASDLAKETSYEFLCLGAVGLVIGIVLAVGGRPPAKPSGRFGTLRKIGEEAKKSRRPKSKTNLPPGSPGSPPGQR